MGRFYDGKKGKIKKPRQIKSATLHSRSDGTTNENWRSCNETGVSDINTKEWHFQRAAS